MEVSKKDVYKMLCDFNIKKSDFVVVHISLKSIGTFKEGANGLLDAFVSYLSDGMFMVPTHTWKTVNRENPIFDVTKTESCVGVFTKICTIEALKRDNAVRTLHPTHSAALFGKHAKEYAKSEIDIKSRTAPEGVWGRLYNKNAKVLLIGVGLERNTYLHSIDEEYNGLPYDNKYSFFDSVTIDENGKEHICKNMNCDCYWRSSDFPKLEKYLQKNDVLMYGKLGNANVICFDVKKGHDTIIELCKKTKNPKDFSELIKNI